MPGDAANPPNVFISYSHDSPEHADRVLELADRLRADGIDCVLDQYADSPPEGWPRWTEQQLREANFVLVICTPTYNRRAMGTEEPGKGLGVRWESTLTYQYLYNAGTTNDRFIPVLLEPASLADIPTPLQGTNHYLLPADYERLYRRLTDQPLTPKPPIGPLRALSPRPRRQDFFVAPAPPPQEPPTQLLENVPYERNPFFTGRENQLNELHEALQQTHRAVLSGLGGIGKTQTAVEYTYRYREEYHYIFWIRAETEIELRTGFVEIAKLLALPEQEAKDPTETVQAVRRWLGSHSGWPLIFDNVDRPEVLEPLKACLPLHASGHILLTARVSVLDTLDIVQPLELEQMQPAEALAFLFKRTGRQQRDPAEQRAAQQLALELGYLPLALEQAGAYLVAKRARFQEYLTSYKRQRLALLNQSLPKVGNYPASVATTWALNFREVERDPVAAELLRLSAFVSADRIPLDLLATGASELGSVLAEALASTGEEPLRLNDALEPLLRYSLIRLEVNEQTYSIHRLVQQVVKDQLDAALQRTWAERTVRAVNQAFPDVTDYRSWPRCQLYLPHAQACVDLIGQWALTLPEAGRLLNQMGYYLDDRAQYQEAEPLSQRAIAIGEKSLGPEHPGLATDLSSLALLYWNQGKYEQAEPLYQRALAIYEERLGLSTPTRSPHEGTMLSSCVPWDARPRRSRLRRGGGFRRQMRRSEGEGDKGGRE